LDLGNLAEWKSLGLGSLIIVPFVLYKIYRLWQEEKKGKNVDDRIDAYSTKLQSTVDKMAAKIEELQIIREKLVTENAMFGAKLTVALSEVEDLRKEVEQHILRIKYLEGLLKDKGVTHV
jgi:hypothetical protein